jgi:DNA-binding CsgD family transcriptional regulator
MGEDCNPDLTRAAIRLSPRQVECLNLTALGLSSAEIAADLGISSRTVDQHIGDACVRLKVRRRVHAVACAIGMGLLKTAYHSAH